MGARVLRALPVRRMFERPVRRRTGARRRSHARTRRTADELSRADTRRSVRVSTGDRSAAPGNAPNPPKSGHAGERAPDARASLAGLTPLIYEQLRRIARRQRRRERPDLTLSTTDLVHEGYVRLVASHAAAEDAAHLLGIASIAMRRILVEHARRRRALKRGGGQNDLSIDDETAMAGDAEHVLGVHEALSRLAELDARLARVVECRYFGALTEEETARALGVTARTVRRDWVKAKGWLYRELRDGGRT